MAETKAWRGIHERLTDLDGSLWIGGLTFGGLIEGIYVRGLASSSDSIRLPFASHSSSTLISQRKKCSAYTRLPGNCWAFHVKGAGEIQKGSCSGL